MGLGNFLKKAGKSIQHNAKAVGKIVENPVLVVAKSIINTVNDIIDYADKKKMMREEKIIKSSTEIYKKTNSMYRKYLSKMHQILWKASVMKQLKLIVQVQMKYDVSAMN